MTRQYCVAASATKNLNEISEYFMHRNVEAGERFIKDFDRKCRNLVQFPNIGRSYSHISPGLRGTLLQGYIIFYEVTDTAVTILHVVSGRQDLETLLGDGSYDSPEY